MNALKFRGVTLPPKGSNPYWRDPGWRYSAKLSASVRGRTRRPTMPHLKFQDDDATLIPTGERSKLKL